MFRNVAAVRAARGYIYFGFGTLPCIIIALLVLFVLTRSLWGSVSIGIFILLWPTLLAVAAAAGVAAALVIFAMLAILVGWGAEEAPEAWPLDELPPETSAEVTEAEACELVRRRVNNALASQLEGMRLMVRSKSAFERSRLEIAGFDRSRLKLKCQEIEATQREFNALECRAVFKGGRWIVSVGGARFLMRSFGDTHLVAPENDAARMYLK
jgi:hypothetical protein